MLLVEKAVETRIIKDDVREYLGISQLGHPCSRFLYYEFRMFLPAEELSPRRKRLYGRGHKEEPIIIEDLESVGVELISTQSRTVTCHGHVQGHLDAVLIGIHDAPKTPHLGEFKTSATKYFNPLVKSRSVKKSFPSHYDQMQGYMHQFKLTRALYICVNKEDDRRYYERIDYDKSYALGLFEKALDIVIATRLPARLSEDPNFYRCHENFCRYRGLCHFPSDKNNKTNRTCRSCNYIEVHDKGRWKCTKKKEYRSFKKQLKACKKWKM